MAVSQTTRTALLIRKLLLALALLFVFGAALAGLQRDSLWFDEAYTLYVVRDEARPPDSVLSQARYLWDSLRSAAARARADVHPPLYFVLMDVWTLLAGESVFAVRLPSLLAGMTGLAAIYALGRRLFDHRAGLMALMVLGTATIFIYYSRETRMYSLLLALAALATLAYLRWRDAPTLARTVVYGALLAALPYTHYAGAFTALAHALHLLLTRPRRVLRWLLPGGLALLLFAPWVPSLLWQMAAHGGPAAPAFTDAGIALAALVFFFTGGYGGLYLLPFVLGDALPRARRHADALALLLLWLGLPALALFVLNIWVPSIFQVRYLLSSLPAGALLVAYGLRWAGVLPARRGASLRPYAALVSSLLLALMIYTQLTIYPYVWPPRPRWGDAVRQMTATRQPLEPALTLIPAHNPAAYYDRQYGIRRHISLDLAWRWQEPADMARYAAHLQTAESVWLVMPSTFASTWDAARALLEGRRVGYRDSVMDMVFYRFDRSGGDDLWFGFGDLLEYRGGIQHQLYAHPGEDFCFEMQMQAALELPPGYAVDFSLTQGYDTVRARTMLTLDPAAAGAQISLAPCIPLPAETPAGPHHLRVRVYEQAGGHNLPLLENGTLYWSESLVMALVHVS